MATKRVALPTSCGLNRCDRLLYNLSSHLQVPWIASADQELIRVFGHSCVNNVTRLSETFMQSRSGSISFGKTTSSPLLLNSRGIRTCHVILPGDPKPISAIWYDNKFYTYLKFYPATEPAERAARRLIEKGEAVVLTQIPKGLILWVLEPDAQPTRHKP